MPMLVLEGHEHRVTCLAYAPAGGVLASGGLDQTVRLWDLSNGRGRVFLEGSGGDIEELAFGPDGRALATLGRDRGVRLWDLATGRMEAEFRDDANCFALSSDGGTLLVGTGTSSRAIAWNL